MFDPVVHPDALTRFRVLHPEDTTDDDTVTAWINAVAALFDEYSVEWSDTEVEEWQAGDDRDQILDYVNALIPLPGEDYYGSPSSWKPEYLKAAYEFGTSGNPDLVKGFTDFLNNQYQGVYDSEDAFADFMIDQGALGDDGEVDETEFRSDLFDYNQPHHHEKFELPDGRYVVYSV